MRALCRTPLAEYALTALTKYALNSGMAKTAILRACETVGGQTALARALGLRSQGTVSGWIAKGSVPAERVLQIEAVTDGVVTRFELRPDLYPREQVA